jgi:hypothetical protein
MMRRLSWILFAAACDERTPEEICPDVCRYYSECDPNVRPLEDMCIAGCYEKLADPKRVIIACETSAPRHPVDRYSGLLSVRSTVIRALECTLDHDCPMGQDPSEPRNEDPCAGVEEVCLDGTTRDQRCGREQQIDSDRCSEGYAACIDGGAPQETCGVTLQSCYNQAFEKAEACRRAST